MFSLIQISKKFILKSSEINIIDKVSFDFPNTGLVLLIGESGSGKTTLLNFLSLNDFPDSGEIYYNDINVKDISNNYLRKELISNIFQNNNLIDDLNIYQNIDFTLKIQDQILDEKKLTYLLEELNLSDKILKKYPKELSGGEIQKIVLIKVLLRKSEILIADEPLSSMDEESRFKSYQLLKEFSKDKLVIMTSHDYKEFLNLSDIILKIDNGSLTIIKDSLEKKIKTIKPIETITDDKINIDKYVFKDVINHVFTSSIRYFLTIFLLTMSIAVIKVMISMFSLNLRDSIENIIVSESINEIMFYNNEKFDKEYLEQINEKFEGINFIEVYETKINYENNIPSLSELGGVRDYLGQYYNSFFNFNGLIKIDENNLQGIGIDNLLVGNYPKTRLDGKFEILITPYIYEHFKGYGYKNSDNIIYKINNFDDIVGKELYYNDNTFVISGIINIKSQAHLFEYAKEEYPYKTDFPLVNFKNFSRDSLIYIHNSFVAEDVIRIYTLSEYLTKDNLILLVNDINSHDGLLTLDNYIISREIQLIDDKINDNKKYLKIYLIVSIMFLLFSLVVLINLSQYLIIKKSGKYKIMKSLGLGNKYFYQVYLIYSLIIIILVYISSTILGKLIINLLNKNFNINQVVYIELYELNVYSYSFSILCLIVTLFLGIILPLKRKINKSINRMEIEGE